MALESPTASASLSTSVESSAPRWKYEVFLSFSGTDTRRGFTYYLYNELQNREIKTFMDVDPTSLDRGEGISQSILEAIQESRFAIVVLSQNYASSSWCLDELTQIMQCMENKETILPVFYHVDPSDVRHQRGSFGAAFAAHEARFKDQKERLMKWRDALNKIGSIFGWACGSGSSE
ncbi:TMV resistance protein N-like [Rosa rugosa]|uniref:TMV resistance protein N-like n=1 Tax=Rosa rugosa TaxID=74645 RepID=UPI002B408A13|nr:TMV resistance protein N-like [Rosa rugosa]